MITLRPPCGLHDNNFSSRDIENKLKGCMSSLIRDIITNSSGYIQVFSRKTLSNLVVNCPIVSIEVLIPQLKHFILRRLFLIVL